MAYEFAEDEPAEDIPTAPDFWHLKAERIFQIVPFEPLFVKHFSVIEDPKTWQLGIDTNDPLPDSAKVEFGDGPDPVGLMRIETLNNATTGYLVDLRYARNLIQRPLDFDYTVYKDEDPNALHKTVPVLGAIFHDPEREKLRLRSKHQDMLKGFATGLMSFVDVERAKRGASVWAHSPELTPKKETGTTIPNIQFSAQTSEVSPETE